MARMDLVDSLEVLSDAFANDDFTFAFVEDISWLDIQKMDHELPTGWPEGSDFPGRYANLLPTAHTT